MALFRLPNELLSQCLGESEDVTHLWMKCRNVSHQFRAALDSWFRLHILPMTSIEFDWANWEYLDAENLAQKCFFRLQLNFDGFEDEAKEVARFCQADRSDFESDSEDPRYTKRLKRKWRETMNMYGGDTSFPEDERGDRFDLVPWTIQIRSMVNDTELPGYVVDYDARKICFRWREAFQCFFREQIYIDQACDPAVMSHEPNLPESSDHGQDDEDVRAPSARMFSSRTRPRDMLEARKAIRRHRMVKHFRPTIPNYRVRDYSEDDEEDYGDWSPEEFGEKQKLRRMQDLDGSGFFMSLNENAEALMMDYMLSVFRPTRSTLDNLTSVVSAEAIAELEAACGPNWREDIAAAFAGHDHHHDMEYDEEEDMFDDEEDMFDEVSE